MSVYLYHLTLQKNGAITHAIYGNFSAPKAQEVVIARGRILELLRPDESGKVQVICSVELFSLVRSMLPFRLTGGNRDYVVLGTDSGRIAVLEYKADRNVFERIHLETFGKSGCRRIVPGQYLAADPRGRAVMIAATEKQKLVYVLNRDSAARLTISSPLEAHKSHTLVWSVAGLDVGFENPQFGAIELDYGDIDRDPTGEALRSAQKMLTLYELDLGLNHVVRKASEPVDNSASLLITVPGGSEGPSGLLVCCENQVLYRQMGQPELRVLLPRRRGMPREQPLLIVATATHRQKDMFFFLLQSELGDLYKVKLTYSEDRVQRLHVKYFDTLPSPANALCVLKTGFLFAAFEFGNHAFYQFQSIGDDDTTTPEVTSDEADAQQPVEFELRPLRNLLLIDEPDSLAPIVDLRVADLLREESPQLYVACGRGPRSTLRVLRHGLPVSEIAVAGDLPGTPNAIFTLRRQQRDEHDRYIVLSFPNATLIVQIGESVEEVKNAEKLLGLAEQVPTLLCRQLADDSWVQVHPNGIRHIRFLHHHHHHQQQQQQQGSESAAGPGAGEALQVQEWPAPARRRILHAAANPRQIAVGLQGGELATFELDESGQLQELERRELGREIACLDIAPLPEGRQRARFLAIGELVTRPDGSQDAVVRVLSLEPDEGLRSLALQSLPAVPESLCIVPAPSGGGTLHLNVGLRTGVLLRSLMDANSGELTDVRQRFLGSRRVRLFRVRLQEQSALLALSSRPWIAYALQGRPALAPLSYQCLEYAASFSSPQCPEGLVAIAGNSLRILALERLGETFHQVQFPLRYTPRQLHLHPTLPLLLLLETDQRTIPVPQRRPSSSSAATAADGANAMQLDGLGQQPPPPPPPPPLGEGEAELQAEAEAEARAREFGAPRSEAGTWASCLRLFDPASGRTLQLVELGANEAGFCLATCVFHDRPSEEVYVCVGAARGLHFLPRRAEGGVIHVFRLHPPVPEAGHPPRLELVHSTPTDEPPLALCAFQGRLLAGLGRSLRLYDLGKKKLLRKCENKSMPFVVRTLHAQGDRIVVGDMQEGAVFVRYQRQENLLIAFADDFQPRHTTCSELLDYDTVAIADKFGTVTLLRLPEETSEDIETDQTGSRFRWEQQWLNGAPTKLQTLCQFHVGETVTALRRATLSPGGQEALVYATVHGAIGAFLPFTSREDVDFFSHLEMHMRSDAGMPNLVGRDHMAFRSYYSPVRFVYDGDLCELYTQLDPQKQRHIASELDRTPAEVQKKLEDLRNKIL